jgi:predicted transcriptional regulator
VIKSILGSLSRERILTFITAREQGYALEIIEFWKCPDRPIKRELNNLEEYGVLTSKAYGKTIVYSINPRYFLRKELTALLLKMIEAYPPEWNEKLFFNRRRSRAKGKPVKYLKDLQNGDQKQ